MSGETLEPATVERVARALCLTGPEQPDNAMPNGGPAWKYYVPLAEAAIAAIPDPAMSERIAELQGLAAKCAPMFPITTGQSCLDYVDVHFGEGHSSQAMTMNPEHWDALNALLDALSRTGDGK